MASGRPVVTIVLMAINVVVWLLIKVTGGSTSRLYELFAIHRRGICVSGGDGYYPQATAQTCGQVGHWLVGVTDGAFWQVITSAFTHLTVPHIAVNMLSLWFLGPTLEAAIGRVRFVIVYLISAVAGSLAVLAFAEPQMSTVGASGAIFGLMGAYLVLTRRHPEYFNQVLVWLGINLVVTFTIPGISWQAHLGGLVGGALAAFVIGNLRSSPR